MTVQIDTTADNVGIRFHNQTGTVPAAPSSGYSLMFAKGDGVYYGIPTGTILGPTQVDLYRNGSDTIVQNSVTETDIIPNTVVPGGLLGSNGRITITLHGRVKQTVVGTITLKLYYGGSSIWSLALAPGAVTADKLSETEIRFTANGASNAQYVEGWTDWYDATSSVPTRTWNEATGIAVDSTVAQNLRLTGTWSTTNSGLVFTAHHILVTIS